MGCAGWNPDGCMGFMEPIAARPEPVVVGVICIGELTAEEPAEMVGEVRPTSEEMSDCWFEETGFGWTRLRPDADEVNGGGLLRPARACEGVDCCGAGAA